MMDDFVLKEKVKEQMLEPLLEYAGACHVKNIVDDMSREDISNDDISTSPELDKRIKKLIRNHRRKANFQNVNRGILRIMPKVAVFILILFTSFFILFTSVEAFRVGVYNLVIDAQEKYSNIKINEDSDNNDNAPREKAELPTEWKGAFVPEFIPEGYNITRVEAFSYTKLLHYTNQEGKLIVYLQSEGEDADINIDTENAAVEDITVSGSDGILVKKGSSSTLVWHKNDTVFSLMTDGVDGSILLQMAESLKIN